MEKRVSKITCPVLIIEHMKDPFAVQHTPHLKTAFPQAAFEQILHGHVALEVTATEFAALLREWIFRERGLAG